ncbi:hypothetical protein C8R45DRAFT_947662 [Mycena sanguinolenta]|nr:hypothetical protein C8R45DRAFT_947662 [Mycena sanguinolenta]
MYLRFGSVETGLESVGKRENQIGITYKSGCMNGAKKEETTGLARNETTWCARVPMSRRAVNRSLNRAAEVVEGGHRTFIRRRLESYTTFGNGRKSSNESKDCRINILESGSTVSEVEERSSRTRFAGYGRQRWRMVQKDMHRNEGHGETVRVEGEVKSAAMEEGEGGEGIDRKGERRRRREQGSKGEEEDEAGNGVKAAVEGEQRK